MGIFSRVLTSIRRYKGRTFMLLMAIAVIGFLISGFMLVNHATSASIQQVQRSMPLVFSINLDHDYFLNSQNKKLLTPEIVYEIGNLPYVSHFDYTLNYQVFGYFQSYWLDELNMGVPDENPYQHFRVYGVSRPEVIYIESGMYELYAGRLFTMEEVQPIIRPSVAPALISREFAEMNELSLGSQVQLMNASLFYLPEDAQVPEGGFSGMYWGETLWNHPYNQVQNVIYEFEIVGIFEFTRIARGNNSDLMNHQSLVNLFLVPNWRVHEIMSDVAKAWQLWADVFNMHDWEDGVIEMLQMQADSIMPLWVLEDLDDMASFIKAANQILPPAYEIDDGLIELIRPMINATDSLNTIIGQVLWMGGGVMTVVLTLLILLYLRERKHEMGIYLALGERKIKLVFQMLLEVLLISVIGLILSFFVANLVAENVSLSMLRTELAGMSRSEDYWPSMLEMVGFGQELTPDEMLEHFSVSLDIRTMFLIFVVGASAVIASTIVPVAYILELNPKDILMKARIE